MENDKINYTFENGNILVKDYKMLDIKNINELIKENSVIIYYNKNRKLELYYDKEQLKIIFYCFNKKLFLNEIYN